MIRKRAGLRMHIVRTFECRQQSADDCLRIFIHKKHAASVGLRHACMNVSAGLSEAYATPSLLL